uniref:Uncharacterized protein n=1 Tax=Anguilla anguilla TaxID=7936 RepID=A0A0E9WMP5_ANGAN
MAFQLLLRNCYPTHKPDVWEGSVSRAVEVSYGLHDNHSLRVYLLHGIQPLPWCRNAGVWDSMLKSSTHLYQL